MLNSIFRSKGVKLAFMTALISGLAVFFNKFAVTKNINPYQFTALKNVLVALLFSLILLTPLVFKKLRTISKNNAASIVTQINKVLCKNPAFTAEVILKPLKNSKKVLLS
jgi:uncharacterized membrane protein